VGTATGGDWTGLWLGEALGSGAEEAGRWTREGEGVGRVGSVIRDTGVGAGAGGAVIVGVGAADGDGEGLGAGVLPSTGPTMGGGVGVGVGAAGR
jgi:hypothetical protein